MTPLRIGVISDTHGLLRPEAVHALTGVEAILHAGDAGKPEVLERLAEIAPVYAVRGNVDHGEWAQALPLTRAVELGGLWLYVLHDRAELDLNPVVSGFAAVISGHTHQPLQEKHNGVLYLNPGSAGPRRFKLPVCLAILEIEGEQLRAQIVNLPG